MLFLVENQVVAGVVKCVVVKVAQTMVVNLAMLHVVVVVVKVNSAVLLVVYIVVML